MFFCTLRTWGDASWSQLRPGEVSHRSVKFGGVGGAVGEHRIDECQKLSGGVLPNASKEGTFEGTNYIAPL